MFIKRDEGIALTFVLISVVLLGIFGTTVMNMTDRSIDFFSRTIDKESSLYYAEAGYNRYLFFLNQDPYFFETVKSDNLENEEKIPFEDGYYKLEITPPATGGSVVTVKSTGWLPGKEPRTIEVEIARQTFANWVYGTNKEEIATTGEEIWWVDGDVVNGPLRTNGNLHINGDPTFNGTVEFSGTDYLDDDGNPTVDLEPGSNPNYNKGEPIYKSEPAKFPETNDNLKNIAQSNGYYFQGRTCIMIDADAQEDRQLKIRNQDGTIQYEPLPPNGVIYVDRIGNYNGKFNYNSGNVFVSGKLDGRLTIAAKDNIYITGYDPTVWDVNPSNFSEGGTYYTGGITYADSIDDGQSNDMLGLVSENNIEILHANWPRADSSKYYDNHWDHPSYDYNVAIEDIEINASMFTLDGSFGFERYNEGSEKGTITLRGSVFQNNRGPVGTFNSSTGEKRTGYDKNYNYDRRLRKYTPPYYVSPENAGWEILNWRIVN